MPSDCDNKDPPKPKFDPFECLEKKESSCNPIDKKVDSKKTAANDPCEKYYPKGLDKIFKKSASPPTDPKASPSTCPKESPPTCPEVSPPTCPKESPPTCPEVSPPSCPKVSPPTGQKRKSTNLPLIKKIKLPSFLTGVFSISPDLINNIKKKIPEIDTKQLKNLEYGKLLKYGFCKLNVWIRENCDPKKMADKGSGAPSRPMKFPYTFSAKIAQFPMGHYVKNQWIWKYYVVAFAACMPIFYSINKLANSPGNVAKWAEIRRKEAAEHHH